MAVWFRFDYGQQSNSNYLIRLDYIGLIFWLTLLIRIKSMKVVKAIQ